MVRLISNIEEATGYSLDSVVLKSGEEKTVAFFRNPKDDDDILEFIVDKVPCTLSESGGIKVSIDETEKMPTLIGGPCPEYHENLKEFYPEYQGVWKTKTDKTKNYPSYNHRDTHLFENKV